MVHSKSQNCWTWRMESS